MNYYLYGAEFMHLMSEFMHGVRAGTEYNSWYIYHLLLVQNEKEKTCQESCCLVLVTLPRSTKYGICVRKLFLPLSLCSACRKSHYCFLFQNCTCLKIPNQRDIEKGLGKIDSAKFVPSLDYKASFVKI